MNKTRYKIATLTGSAVMAAMLLSLLILNIVFNKKIELRAENAIKNVFTLNSDEYLNYESENDTGSLYYASLVYMGADSENRDDIYQILTPKEKKLIDWYETHPSDEMQRAKINEATYYMKARTEYYEDGNERLLAYVDVTGDAGVVIEESADNNTIFLYAANKADGRSAADGRDKAYIRKIDGRTGTVAWTKTFDASAENAGGAYAPVHIGKNELNGTVIASLSAVALNDGTDGGLIIALDKSTGEEKWRVEQADGIWSAPVVIYDENGKGYILQCDRGGKLTLYSGIDGQAMCSIDLGSRIESTPAVFNNTLVVGTRGVDGSGQGPKIVGIRIG